MTRVVLGLPLYEGETHLREAVESLMAQTYTDFAVIVCDDSRSDGPGESIAKLTAHDQRFRYERNPTRLGMTRNWRRCVGRGRALHPDAVYFAWASDHDVWHPRWLEALVKELDAHPEAVLAYPLNVRIDANSAPILTPWRFDTAGQRDTAHRLATTAHGMFAGDMVYGLFRAAAQARAGVFRSVLLPDRLLLSELAVQGEFRQVNEILWYRRFAGIASLSRQRASFWPNGPPLVAYIPWWLVHPAVLAYDLVIRGRGRPELKRGASLRLAASFVLVNLRFELFRKVQRAHARLRKRVERPRKLAGKAVDRAAHRGFPPAVAIQTSHGYLAARRANSVRARMPESERPADRVAS